MFLHCSSAVSLCNSLEKFGDVKVTLLSVFVIRFHLSCQLDRVLFIAFDKLKELVLLGEVSAHSARYANHPHVCRKGLGAVPTLQI